MAALNCFAFWRQTDTQTLFIIAVLIVFWLFLVHCWYSLGRPVTISTRIVIFAVLTVFWLFLTIGTPMVIFAVLTVFWQFLVHCWYTVGTRLYQQCTNRHKQSKTVKRQLKEQKWPLVYQSSHVHTESAKYTKSASASAVRRIHKAAQAPLPWETSITRAWAVATARRPWAGLTVCVYMDVHASGSRSLPCAATLSSTYWWCLQLV